MSIAEKLNRQETEAKINIRAWKDPAFREQLRTNPRAALHEMGMTKVPNDLNIQVAQEEEKQWIIRLYNRPLNFRELSDVEIEAVACGEAQDSKCCPKNPT